MGDIYLRRTPTAEGISPPEILVSTTNNIFAENKLLQSLPSQFSQLFADTPYTPYQKAQTNQFQERFQQAWIEGTSRAQKERHESGPQWRLKTPDGQSISVVNLGRGESEVSYSQNASRELALRLHHKSRASINYHRFQVIDAKGKKIGDFVN